MSLNYVEIVNSFFKFCYEQVEPTFSSPSSLAGPAFGRMPGPAGFHNSIPGAATVSASPFAVTATSSVIHPATLFSGDANGGFVNASERPKKVIFFLVVHISDSL